MEQFNSRPDSKDRQVREEPRRNLSPDMNPSARDRRSTQGPEKFNTRATERRISWDNDLYERQSI